MHLLCCCSSWPNPFHCTITLSAVADIAPNPTQPIHHLILNIIIRDGGRGHQNEFPRWSIVPISCTVQRARSTTSSPSSSSWWATLHSWAPVRTQPASLPESHCTSQCSAVYYKREIAISSSRTARNLPWCCLVALLKLHILKCGGSAGCVHMYEVVYQHHCKFLCVREAKIQ